MDPQPPHIPLATPALSSGRRKSATRSRQQPPTSLFTMNGQQVEYSISDLHTGSLPSAPGVPSISSAPGASTMPSAPNAAGGPLRNEGGRERKALKPSFYQPNQVRHRRRTTKEQLFRLENVFKDDPKPVAEIRKVLSDELGMTTREVQIWFQNRRAKQKNQVKKPEDTVAEQPSSSSQPRRPSMNEALTDASGRALRRMSDIPQSSKRAGKAHASPSGLARTEAMVNAALSAPSTSATKIPAMSLPLLGDMPGIPSVPATMPMPVNFAMAGSSTGVPQSMKKKKKRGGNGDDGRYSSARVYHATFDGSEVPPVKAEDLEPNSDDEGFNSLDPSNLPNFMMPGMPPVPFGGIGSNVPSYPHPVNTGMISGGPFNPMQQSSGLAAALFTGMLSTSQPAPALSGLSLNTYGLQASMATTSAPGMLSSPTTTLPSAGISSSDLSLGSVDPSMAFIQTLMALSQQSQPIAQPSLASPLGGSPPVLPVPSMVSPGPIPGSAFSSYDARSHPPPMLLASSTMPAITASSLLAANAPPDLFGASTTMLYSAGSNQTSSSGPSSPPY